MDQLRTASSGAAAPKKLWVIGDLPVLKQFQVLGLLMVMFLVFAVLMLFLDGRQSGQSAAAAATATEMQMRSVATWLAMGGSALAAQGQASALRRGEGQPRALMRGTGRAAQRRHSARHQPRPVAGRGDHQAVDDVKQRWERVDVAADRLLANETSLTTLAKGLETLNAGNSAVLELAQQAAQQIGQGGGSLREIEYSNQLAVLSQRIAKECQFTRFVRRNRSGSRLPARQGRRHVPRHLGRPAGGSEPLRLSPVKGDDARATLAELAKRFAACEGGVNAILANMPRLVVAKQAARSINTDAEPLLIETTKLSNEFEGNTVRKWTLGAAIFFAVLAMLSL